MRNIIFLFAILIFISCQQKKADIIIRNANVYDGSGKPPVIQDVAIGGDTIFMVGNLADVTAPEIIDGSGFALAPGFIDTHSHHGWNLDKEPDALAVVSQGVTTIVVGQDGGSNTPLKDYFQEMTDNPAAVNIASYSGHNTLRDIVMGKDFKRQANGGEVDSMLALLKADMDAGALGLSTGLEYDPGIYSAKDEVLILAKALKSYDGRYISHMRSEDRYFWDALNEIVTIGKEAEIPVQISHFKLAMVGLWNQTDSALNILEDARKNGVNVTADIYPYTYWSSTIRVLFPDRNFKDLKEAEFILKNVTTPEGVIFSNYEPNPEYNGKSLKEVAEVLKLTPAKALIELIDRLDKCDAKGEECDGSIVATSMDENDVKKLMQWEFANICSDGASGGRHPRGFGAFTRVLKYYVREQKALSLEEAIYKMTALSAKNVGIQRRGEIKPGNYADLVLFHPDSVGDRSTIADPQAVSVGIKYVWVNGVKVFSEGKTAGVKPGRVIRRGSN